MEIDSHDVLRIARRSGWIVLLIMVVAGVGAFVLASRQDEQFAATATFLVLPAEDAKDDEAALQASGRLTPTYRELVTSGAVLDRVVDTLELPVSTDDLRSSVTASIVPDTYLIEVTVTNSDPEEAARIATTFVEEFENYIESPSDVDGGALAAPIRVTDPAAAPTEPYAPRPLFLTVLGAFAGFLIGLAAVALLVLRESMRRGQYRSSGVAATEHARS